VTQTAPPWVLVDPGVLREGETVRLDPVEARHLATVIRREVGDPVLVADGNGVVAPGVVRSCRRGKVDIELLEVTRAPRPTGPCLTLGLAVLHGQAMDWAVQKAVEMGVESVTPWVAERSQLSGSRARTRVAHWRRVARQALKQCRRAYSMELPEPVSLAEALDEWTPRVGVVAHRQGAAVHELPRACGDILLVGPEGGLSLDEERRLDECGWWRLRLGQLILRSETAAVVGAALMIHARELGG